MCWKKSKVVRNLTGFIIKSKKKIGIMVAEMKLWHRQLSVQSEKVGSVKTFQ